MSIPNHWHTIIDEWDKIGLKPKFGVIIDANKLHIIVKFTSPVKVKYYHEKTFTFSNWTWFAREYFSGNIYYLKRKQHLALIGVQIMVPYVLIESNFEEFRCQHAQINMEEYEEYYALELLK